MKSRQIIAALVVVATITIAASLIVVFMHNGDEQIEIRYSYESSIQNGTTQPILDDNEAVIIDMNIWGGNDYDLFTAWSEDGHQLELSPFNGVRWIQYTFHIETDPGVTIKANDIVFGIPDPELTDPDQYGYVSAYMMYNDQKVHSSITDTILTTDSEGKAQMSILILTDDLHIYPYFSKDMVWTLI